MTSHTPFWLDHAYDRANADTGTQSRYVNYARQADLIALVDFDYDDPRAAFAAAAWRIANGPVMSPPFVRSHRRILAATLQRSDWNGNLIAVADLVVPRLDALARLRDRDGYAPRTWSLDEMADRFDGPTATDLAQRWYITSTATVAGELPLDLAALPVINPINLAESAYEYLPHIVAAMNDWLGPAVYVLEGRA